MKHNLNEAFGAPDDRFHAATLCCLRRIQAAETRRKPLRKSAVLLAAILFLLALGSVGIATGLFDSIFARMQEDGFAGTPETDYAHMDAIADRAVFDETIYFESGVACRVALEQAYYNGQQLALGWRVEPVIDNAQFYEKGDERYAEVYEDFSISEGQITGSIHAEEFERRWQESGWAGIAWSECYLGDGLYLKGMFGDAKGHIYPETDRYWKQDGANLRYAEYETPLPEAAQDQDALELCVKLYCQLNWFCADGEKLYSGQAPAEEREVRELTIRIPRSEDYESRTLHSDASFPGFSAAIDVNLTPIGAELRIESQYPEAWPELIQAERTSEKFYFPMNLSKDIPIGFEIYADTPEGSVLLDETLYDLSDTFRFTLSENTTALRIRPFYANSGAHTAEDVVLLLNK